MEYADAIEESANPIRTYELGAQRLCAVRNRVSRPQCYVPQVPVPWNRQ